MQLSPMLPKASSMDTRAALSALCAAWAIRFERRELLRALLDLGEVVGQELTAQVTARELAREMKCHPGTASRWMRELRELGLAWLTIDSSGRGYRVVLDLAGEPPFFCPDPDGGTIRMQPGCDPDVIRMQPGCDRDATGLQPGCDPDAIGTDDATRSPAIPTSPTPTPPTPPLRACEGAGAREPHTQADARETRKESLRALTRLLLGLLSRTDVDADQAYRAASSLLVHLGGDLERAEACARWTVRRLERRGVAWREAGLYLAALSDAQDVARWEVEGEGLEELLELPVTAPAPPPPETGGVSPALAAHLERLRAGQGGGR